MAKATVTSKGQITIPKSIRDQLRLHSGDKVDFYVSENGDAILRLVAKNAEDVFGLLSSPNRKSLSTREINHRLKKAIKEKFT